MNLTVNGKKDADPLPAAASVSIRDERGIDLTQAAVLRSVYGEWTKNAGYRRPRAGQAAA